MNMPLHVLIIEDSAADAELLVSELKRSYAVAFQRVETAADLRAALTHQWWDVILADYRLPGFDAPAALKILQMQALDIPFIIVSGTIGEEAAAAIMKAGAHDFIAKANLARLIPVIERELREMEARRKRHWAEGQLRRANERFSKIFHASPIGIAITSMADSTLVDVNPKFLEMLGYVREEVIGRSTVELGVWADLDKRDDMRQMLFQQGAVLNLEIRLRTKSGAIRKMLASFEVIDLEDTPCALAMVHDITERRQAEEELAALYNATSVLFKADNLLDLGHQIVQAVVANFGQIDCGLLLTNPKQNSLVRLARSGQYGVVADMPLFLDGPGLVPKAVRTGQLLYAPDVAAHPQYIVGDPRTRSELVVPLQTTKGVLGVLDLQSAALDAFSQRDLRILTAFAERAAAAIEIVRLYEEISQRAAELEWRVIQRTAELQRAKERVEGILNQTSDAIVLAQLAHGTEQVNPAFQTLFGYAAHETFGLPLLSLVETTEVQAFARVLNAVETTRQPQRVEMHCVRKDKSVFEGDMAIAPLFSDQEKLDGLICSIRDITQRKRAEEELRRTVLQQKELNELKSRFTSMISHEFRTPLAVMQSSLDLLMNYPDRLSDEKKHTYFQNTYNQVQRLTNLLNNILTLSKAEAVGVTYQPTALDLDGLCRQLVEDIHRAFPTRAVRLSSNRRCGAIYADEELLRQAITNLLSNAAKYSPEGGAIQLELSCENEQAVIRIQDAGIGIPPDDLPHLFEPFHRAGNVGKIQGTGLGLAIVKQAVEVHHGTIEVTSQVGLGTTFTITLPNQPFRSD